MADVWDGLSEIGYYVEFDADTLTLRGPNHRAIAYFSPHASGAEVIEAAWEHHLDVEEKIARLDLLLGRPQGPFCCLDPCCWVCDERGLVS